MSMFNRPMAKRSSGSSRGRVARNYQLSDQDLNGVLQLVADHEQEIRDAWRSHFGS